MAGFPICEPIFTFSNFSSEISPGGGNKDGTTRSLHLNFLKPSFNTFTESELTSSKHIVNRLPLDDSAYLERKLRSGYSRFTHALRNTPDCPPCQAR